MWRLALAFTVAIILHLLLFCLPLPNNRAVKNLPPVSREVTINLTSGFQQEISKQKEIDKKQKKIPESKPTQKKPEKKEETPKPQKEKILNQPVERLTPVNYKKNNSPQETGLTEKIEKTAEKKISPRQSESSEIKSSSITAKNSTVSAEERLSQKDEKSKAEKPNKNPQPVITKASPLYKRNPPPSYPVIAKRRGWQGRVILAVDVTPEGSVEEISIKKSSGFSILDKAALEAVKKWRFNPGRRNGEAVAMKVEIPVSFKIN